MKNENRIPEAKAAGRTTRWSPSSEGHNGDLELAFWGEGQKDRNKQDGFRWRSWASGPLGPMCREQTLRRPVRMLLQWLGDM